MKRDRTRAQPPSIDMRIRRIVKQMRERTDALQAEVDQDLTVLDPLQAPPYRLPKNLLDQELRILGEMSDVAMELAAHMRERGVPEDDPDLLMVEAKVKSFAKNAAWVLSEKAREAEEKAAWIKACKARVMARVQALRLPKPDVAEDPTTIH